MLIDGDRIGNSNSTFDYFTFHFFRAYFPFTKEWNENSTSANYSNARQNTG